MELFMDLVTSHEFGKSMTQDTQLYCLVKEVDEKVQSYKEELINPLLTKLQNVLWNSSLASNEAVRFCRKCKRLFPNDATIAQLEYEEHPCLGTHIREFNQTTVGFTSERSYQSYLLSQIDLVMQDPYQAQLLLEAVTNFKPIVYIGCAGVGKSMLLNVVRMVLIQKYGYASVLSLSMLKANAIKNEGRTVHSQYKLPYSFEELDALMCDPASLERHAASLDLRQYRVLLIDEVSNMSTYIFEIINKLHNYHSIDQLHCFGGLQTIFAMDPLQNPPHDHLLAAFYWDRNQFFHDIFNLGLMMDANRNHRFKDESSWNTLLNKIRDLSFTDSDIKSFHDSIGGILQRPNPSNPNDRNNVECRMAVVMDCANAILVSTRRSHNDGHELSYMQNSGWLLQSRTNFISQEVIALENNLPCNRGKAGATIKEKSRAPLADIIQFYSQQIDGGFKEDDMFSMKIVVTEKAQLEAYDSLLQSLLNPDYNVDSQDEYLEVQQSSTNSDEKSLVKLSNAHWQRLVRAKGDIDLNQRNEGKNTVNLAIGSRRCISSNNAGSFLVKGQTVIIKSYDPTTHTLMVQPEDVTGRNLIYPIMCLPRIITESEVMASGIIVKLRRMQFPLINGCATVVNGMAGLTFTTTKLALDNTRTSQPGGFYIFNSRSVPKNLFIRHPLESGKNEGKWNGQVGEGSVFDIKCDKEAWLFNGKVRSLWDRRWFKENENSIIFAAQKLKDISPLNLGLSNTNDCLSPDG
jgi:hypothetical protein